MKAHVWMHIMLIMTTRNNKPQKINMRVTTSQFEITRKNKGNKSSSRSLARFCRRKHKESTAHPSCSTCRQVYIMRNLVRNLSKFVSKAEWLWGRRSRLSALLSTSGRSTHTLGHFVSFSWHSSWYINAFAYLSRRFFTLSSPCGVKLNCWLKAGMRNHLKN